jgi:Tfp pilus assembly protein PilF
VIRLLLLPLVFTLASAAASLEAQTSPRARAIQHLRAGQDALQSERWDEAEREFKMAIELDPLLELAHYGLGQTYMATRRYVEAVRAYLNTRDAFHRAAGEQITENLDGERRLNDQIRSLRDQKGSLMSGRLRSRSLGTSIQQIDDQIRQLETSRRRNTDTVPVTPPYISVALGGAYFRTNAFADAEREWRAALQVDPSIGEAHNNLAVVYFETGRLTEAERSVAAAEKAGFNVNPQLKRNIKERQRGS